VTPGSANNPATVQFKKAVLRLDVTPQITPDNRIIMNVEIRKDSVGQLVNLGGGFQVPSIDTRNVTTQISVNNGDTASSAHLRGGDHDSVDKVPLLGDIPFFGYLFKTTTRGSEKPRAPHLPDAARGERHGQRRQVTAIAGSSGRADSTTMPRCICIGQSVSVGLPGAASPRSGASWRAVSARRSSTPTPSSSASSA